MHFVRDDLVADPATLDPEHPEALLYLMRPDGSGRLVAAMFLMPAPGMPGPEVPGSSARWHHHELCLGADGLLGGREDGDPCPPRTSPTLGADMLHVWLAGESDNPFAADMAPARFRCTLPA